MRNVPALDVLDESALYTWATSWPIRLDLLVAMQDIQSGVVIAIQGRSTVRSGSSQETLARIPNEQNSISL
jgi:hypothetical protein